MRIVKGVARGETGKGDVVSLLPLPPSLNAVGQRAKKKDRLGVHRGGGGLGIEWKDFFVWCSEAASAALLTSLLPLLLLDFSLLCKPVFGGFCIGHTFLNINCGFSCVPCCIGFDISASRVALRKRIKKKG
jgi:hypothetical protein